MNWTFLVPSMRTKYCFPSFRFRNSYSLGRLTYVNIWPVSSCSLVTGRDAPTKSIRFVGTHQVYCASAKPTTSHARSKHAGLLHGELHHNIEFVATDFIVVTETTV